MFFELVLRFGGWGGEEGNLHRILHPPVRETRRQDEDIVGGPGVRVDKLLRRLDEFLRGFFEFPLAVFEFFRPCPDG